MSNGPTNISVVVRCRPVLGDEGDTHSAELLDARREESAVVLYSAKDGPQDSPQFCRKFIFDRVYDGQASQIDIFDDNVRRLVAAAAAGYNATVFAYGQTGSGKTHTMEGYTYNLVKGRPRLDIEGTSADNIGIAPRCIRELYNLIEPQRERYDFKISCSFPQIYNEKVYDLLSEDVSLSQSLLDYAPLRVRWAFPGQFYVEDLRNVDAHSAQELLSHYERGLKRRATASHKMNAQSSRSHSLFQVHVVRVEKGNKDNATDSVLSLVDLAGSEKLSVLADDPKDTVKKENSDINRSLFALGKVISALYGLKDKRARDSRMLMSFVPYRDSVLTKLLKESLGGNSLTLMIACLSPLDEHYHENLNTLLYAARTKAIRNTPRINSDPKQTLVQELRSEIERLRREISGMRESVAISDSARALEHRGGSIATSNGRAQNEMKDGADAAQQQQQSSSARRHKPAVRSDDAPLPASGVDDDLSLDRLSLSSPDPKTPNERVGLGYISDQIEDSVRLLKQLISKNNELMNTVERLEEENGMLQASNDDLLLENEELREQIAAMNSMLRQQLFSSQQDRGSPKWAADDLMINNKKSALSSGMVDSELMPKPKSQQSRTRRTSSAYRNDLNQPTTPPSRGRPSPYTPQTPPFSQFAVQPQLQQQPIVPSQQQQQASPQVKQIEVPDARSVPPRTADVSTPISSVRQRATASADGPPRLSEESELLFARKPPSAESRRSDPFSSAPGSRSSSSRSSLISDTRKLLESSEGNRPHMPVLYHSTSASSLNSSSSGSVQNGSSSTANVNKDDAGVRYIPHPLYPGSMVPVRPGSSQP